MSDVMEEAVSESLKSFGNLRSTLERWWVRDRSRMVNHVLGFVRSWMRPYETAVDDVDIMAELRRALEARGVSLRAPASIVPVEARWSPYP